MWWRWRENNRNVVAVVVVEENNGNVVVVAAVSSIVMSTSIKTSNNMPFLAWNINGLSSKSLGDKSQHIEFLDLINNFDFMILRETWTRSKVIEVRGFRSVTQDATQWLDFNCQKDLQFSMVQDWKRLCENRQRYLQYGLYIPPCNSQHFNVELFKELENDIDIFSSQGSILLMGNLNARTRKFSDSVCKEGNNLITKDQSEFFLCPTQRNSFDNELNNQGKRLLEFVKVQTLGF